MKIKRFFAIVVASCLFLTGCYSSFDWDKSVSKLQDSGYIITRNYTTQEDLDKITHELNSVLALNEKDCTVEVIRYMFLDKEDDKCCFLQFKTEEQAQNYYDLRVEIRFEGSDLKLAVYDDVLIIVNSTDAVDLLKLKFN